MPSELPTPIDHLPCPLCASDSRRVFSKGGYGILECSACGHRFCGYVPPETHVQTTYDDGYFKGGGAGYPDYLGEGKLLRGHGRRYGKMLRKYAPAGRMLDVGCAAGFLLQGFGDEGWKGKGLDPNSTMVKYGREVSGLDLENVPFEEFQSGQGFDLISMIQVLPHFADPKAAFAKAVDLLNSGGLLLIETWDRKSFTARLFGSHWHEYSPPSVLHWFTRPGLEGLGAKFGLGKVSHGRPTKWLDGAHAKSLLSYKLTGRLAKPVLAAANLLVPDNLPIPYPSEDVFWLLLRKP